MMTIDGKQVPVTLPVAEVPPDMPQTIYTHQRDERIDDSLVILPSTLRETPIVPRNDTAPPPANQTSPPANQTALPPSPTNTTQPAPPPAPAPGSNASLPSPTANQTSPVPPPSPGNATNATPPPPPPPPTTPHTPLNNTQPPAPPPEVKPPSPPAESPPPVNTPQPPTTSPTPPASPASTTATARPRPNNPSIIIAAGWLPMFNFQLSSNDIFGPIYPVFTQSPMVIQYIASPMVYYMQILQIVYSIVPANTMTLNSIMDLSSAVTDILRSNAESLSSIVVEEPDGPNLVSRM